MGQGGSMSTVLVYPLSAPPSSGERSQGGSGGVEKGPSAAGWAAEGPELVKNSAEQNSSQRWRGSNGILSGSGAVGGDHLVLPVVLHPLVLQQAVGHLLGQVVGELPVGGQVQALAVDQGVRERISSAYWRKAGPVHPHCSNSSFIKKQGEKSPPSPWKSRSRASLAEELAQIR